jgi:hypothetical protein
MQIDTLKRVQLPVLSHHGRWLISFRGKRAEFVDRASALREAVEQAYQYSKNGSPTEVICVDDRLNLEVVWTYGIDPNPPSADIRPPARPSRGPPRASHQPIEAQRAPRTAQVAHWRNASRKSKENRRVG